LFIVIGFAVSKAALFQLLAPDTVTGLIKVENFGLCLFPVYKHKQVTTERVTLKMRFYHSRQAIKGLSHVSRFGIEPYIHP